MADDSWKAHIKYLENEVKKIEERADKLEQMIPDLKNEPKKHAYRNVWSAAELQAKNERWQLVCANVFGLEWSH